MSEEYLTIEELSARLKIKPKTIKNKMASGIFRKGTDLFSPARIRPAFQVVRRGRMAGTIARRQRLRCQIPQSGGAKVGLDDFVMGGGNVSDLEVFSLSHSIFRRLSFWHSEWKFKRALREAA